VHGNYDGGQDIFQIQLIKMANTVYSI